jgi:hypothetical protein
MDSDQERGGLMRRWVKLTLVALAVLALIVLIVMMISGGEHGPARHFSMNTGSPAVDVSNVEAGSWNR